MICALVVVCGLFVVKFCFVWRVMVWWVLWELVCGMFVNCGGLTIFRTCGLVVDAGGSCVGICGFGFVILLVCLLL